MAAVVGEGVRVRVGSWRVVREQDGQCALESRDWEVVLGGQEIEMTGGRRQVCVSGRVTALSCAVAAGAECPVAFVEVCAGMESWVVVLRGDEMIRALPLLVVGQRYSLSGLKGSLLSVGESRQRRVLIATRARGAVPQAWCSRLPQCVGDEPSEVDSPQAVIKSNRLCHYEGTVTGRLADCVVVLDWDVRLFLWHYCPLDRGRGVREGAKLRLSNVHCVYRDGELRGLVACFYSSVLVLEPSMEEPSSPAVLISHSRCPLFRALRDLRIGHAVAIYDLFEAVATKFLWDSPATVLDMCMRILPEFPRTKRDVYGQFFDHHEGQTCSLEGPLETRDEAPQVPRIFTLKECLSSMEQCLSKIGRDSPDMPIVFDMEAVAGPLLARLRCSGRGTVKLDDNSAVFRACVAGDCRHLSECHVLVNRWSAISLDDCNPPLVQLSVADVVLLDRVFTSGLKSPPAAAPLSSVSKVLEAQPGTAVSFAGDVVLRSGDTLVVADLEDVSLRICVVTSDCNPAALPLAAMVPGARIVVHMGVVNVTNSAQSSAVCVVCESATFVELRRLTSQSLVRQMARIASVDFSSSLPLLTVSAIPAHDAKTAFRLRVSVSSVWSFELSDQPPQSPKATLLADDGTGEVVMCADGALAWQLVCAEPRVFHSLQALCRQHGPFVHTSNESQAPHFKPLHHLLLRCRWAAQHIVLCAKIPGTVKPTVRVQKVYPLDPVEESLRLLSALSRGPQRAGNI